MRIHCIAFPVAQTGLREPCDRQGLPSHPSPASPGQRKTERMWYRRDGIKMNVGLNLALRLVPKYNKIALHFLLLLILAFTISTVYYNSYLSECPARCLTPFLQGQPGKAWWSPSYLCLTQGLGICVCGKVLIVCTHLEAREEGTQRGAGRKELACGQERQKRVCKEGVRKEKKSQGGCVQLCASAYSCAVAENQLRTKFGYPGQSSKLTTSHISRG